MSDILLKTEHLKKIYRGRKGIFTGKQKILTALDDVSFEIEKGKTLGLVGESGCGKSTVAKAILNLIPVNGGRVTFEGKCVYDIEKNEKLSSKEMQKLRREMQIVFQDPSSCLDPRKNVEQIVCEGIKKHKICEQKEVRNYCIEILEKCGLDRTLLMRYPHELSGGQKQRIAIARVFALNTKFIVCDEITAALDVSVQSQILNLLLDIKEQSSLTYLFISHNLDVVKYFCDEIIIMYLGRIIESGESLDIYSNPVHPYTKLLIESIPAKMPEERKKNIIQKTERKVNTKGCSFFPRCPYANTKCKEVTPILKEVDGKHKVACHLI